MKTEKNTDYGRLIIGTREELFAKAVELAAEQCTKSKTKWFDWALTGGSTPQEWYRWCVTHQAIPESVLRKARFTVSDERCVPLWSEQSNFGQATRLLLEPLKVPAEQQQPWPVHLLPAEAAEEYSKARCDARGQPSVYDVCFLGMGDDGHTASIFPGSELLSKEVNRPFAAVDVPGKGWRLTITPSGLGDCGLIVIMTLGAAKAAKLKQVFSGTYDPKQNPVQMVRAWRERVVWLADQAAASGV
jgi:6-phosphogluconolactonase